MNKHRGNWFSYRLILVLTLGLLIGGIPTVFIPNQVFAITNGDDFDDNSKDSVKWGTDEVDGKGVLRETNQRLEYTTTGAGTASHDSVDRKFRATQFPSNADWEVQIDVTNTTSSGLFNSFGIDVRSFRFISGLGWVPLSNGDIEVELAQSGQFWAEFSGGKYISGSDSASFFGPNNFGAVRMAFNSTTKVFTVYYDADPSDGYQWTEFGSFGVAGAGGQNVRNWSLKETDRFSVYTFGYSKKANQITSGQLYGDNFLETGGVALLTAPDKGEIVPNGTVYAVTWITNGISGDVSSARVFYTFGNSGIWKKAAGTLVDPLTRFDWDVPIPAQPKNVRLKVVFKDASGKKLATAQSSQFRIE